MSISALILGGGTLSNGSTVFKGLLEINGKKLVEIAVDACLEALSINDICVVAPPEVLEVITDENRKTLIKATSSENLIDNVIAGGKILKNADYILIVAGDLPFITAKVIDGFISECFRYPSSGYYPILKKETLEEAFPGTERTYAKLKEGTFTGGNIFLIKTEVILSNEEFLRELLKARKSPFKLAGIVGLFFLLKTVLGIITIEEAEKRVSKIVNAPVKAVITEFPEIGIDIDKQKDIEYISTTNAGR